MGENLNASLQNMVTGELQGWQLQVKDGQTGDTGLWRSWRLVINGH
jgi:subtilisin-like proprotein convertase family protein